MRLTFLIKATGAIGLGLAIVAVAWWGILFPGVSANTGLAIGEALPCIASTSSVCSLAMALCGGSHLFGIHHYSPGLFWIGTALLSGSLFAQSLVAAPRRE